MDSQFVSITLKTTFSSLLIGTVWLWSPTAIAQEEFSTPEGTVQRLEEINVPSGTVQQLEGVETKSPSSSPFSIGGALNEDSENDRVSFELKYEPEFSIFGLEVRAIPTTENWLALNQGESPRGFTEIVLFRF